MIKLLFASTLFSVSTLCLISCKEHPFDPPFENAGGYVLGKENCKIDTIKEYWLVDLSIFPSPSTYGDTLTFNGIVYRNVVKTVGLAPQFKYAGARVDFDFHLSSMPVNTSCDVTSPRNYALKEMYVLDQAEIR